MEYLNIANNCRACQDRTLDECQIFIFTSAKIPDIYKETTSLDIHENDGLPKVLCSTCYNRLLEAYNFRKMCSAAVLHFQKILDATPLDIKTDPDVLDAMDVPLRDLNLPPVREDPAIAISDTIFEDENLLEIIKTEPVDDDAPLCYENSPHIHIKQEECAISQERMEPISPEIPGDLECGICNSRFHLIVHLEMHMKRKHIKMEPCEKEELFCEYCLKKFHKKYNLKRHMKAVHEKLRDFHCIKCEKTFSAERNLKVHLLRHEGIKEFKCKICEKLKVTRSELRSHMKIHTTEKGLSCKICPYKCNKMQCLNRHVRAMHDGVRDFHCTKCEKSFTRGEHLRVHMLRHEGIKNFKCTICGKMTVTRSDLNKHMRAHT